MKKYLLLIKPSLILAAGLVLSLSACVFKDLKKEISEVEKLYTMGGKISCESSPDGSFVVLLYVSKGGMNEIVGYTITTDTGHFSFLMPEGDYYLAAFEDRDNDLSYDRGESFGYFGAPDKIVLPYESNIPDGEKRILNLDMRLGQAAFPAEYPSVIDAEKISRTDYAKIGQIATLDDDLFAPENGSTGYWKPLTFLRDFGVGVYFMEPYNPDKIPVLFIHGAVGTPEGWQKSVEVMDRSRFQPWFYYYPSGLRLDKLGGALNELMKRIHQTHEFETLYVVAQSMGGLVARSFIMKSIYDDHQNYIKLFVSISTPWNGHKLTAKGVKGAPTAIPSWYDMVPDSEFIQGIFDEKFPPELKFYLLFSYRGGFSFLLDNNDGTVELSSQLDYRAQDEAEKVYGFDEDHGSIVFSPEYLEYFQEILNAHY